MISDEEMDAHVAHMHYMVGRMREDDIEWLTRQVEHATNMFEREYCLRELERLRAIEPTPPPKPHAERVAEMMRRWKEARAQANSPQES